MTTEVIAFFNNKGGVGKTSLVYQLAWMYADMGVQVVAADLDPQANLTAAFIGEDRLEELWPDGRHQETVYGSVEPLLKGTGDIKEPHLEPVEENLALLVGDLSLSAFEDQLSTEWPGCMDRQERSFRVISSFWRVLQLAATKHGAGIILMDLGPNLGAINRAALIAADYIVVPLAPDLYSLQGLRNLGPTLRRWRVDWEERVDRNPVADLILPTGKMKTVGYVMMQHSVRLDRPVKAYERWIDRIPGTYRKAVLNQPTANNPSVTKDPNCLILLKHYQSLMPLAQEARKPMFHLKPADGAIGAHYQAVKRAELDFKNLAVKIAQRTNISLPSK